MGEGNEVIGQILVFVVIGLMLWLLLIRPAKRNQRAMVQMQESVAPGQRLILTSGILGTAQAVHPDRFDIEVAPGVVLQVAKGAVASLISDDQTPDDRAAGDVTPPLGESGPQD